MMLIMEVKNILKVNFSYIFRQLKLQFSTKAMLINTVLFKYAAINLGNPKSSIYKSIYLKIHLYV